VRSTVGAGDTLLAGYLAAGGGAEGLQTGVAWAAESVAQPGTSLLAPSDDPPPVVLVTDDFEGARPLDAPGEAAAVRSEAGPMTSDFASGRRGQQ
jgi:1-phosphofructokinase